MISDFRELLRRDAIRYQGLMKYKGFAGIGKMLRLLLLTPGFQLSVSIRLQSEIARVPLFGKVLRRIIWYVTTIYFGCDIDPACSVGAGIYLPHPIGIVIGGEWDIGENVSILSGVTLGRSRRPEKRSVIEDGVEIGSGAKLIGEMLIGANSRIGANAVVLSSIPPNSTAVGVPARCVPKRTC